MFVRKRMWFLYGEFLMLLNSKELLEGIRIILIGRINMFCGIKIEFDLVKKVFLLEK